MSGSLLRDPKVFDFNYQPRRLVHRDTQIERLRGLFADVARSPVSRNALIVGRVGTGKTATARHFAALLADEAKRHERPIEPLFVNCRQRKTPHAVLLAMIGHFQPHFPERGFQIPEMVEILRRESEKRRIRFLLVLDEADALLKVDTDLLYTLTRFDEESGGPRGTLSIILVSPKNVLDSMDAATLSTFRRGNMVEFTPYKADELADILRERAELGLEKGSWDQEILEMVAEAAAPTGDARRAIEILENAAMNCDGDTISAGAVRTAASEASDGVSEQRLAGLDLHPQLVLLAAARCLKKKAAVASGDVEKAYARACEELKERPRAHTQFWNYLQELSRLGLVELKQGTSTEGGKGSRSLVTLHDIPLDTFVESMEKRLGLR